MASVDHLFEHSHNETQSEQEYASRDLKAKFSWETTLSQKIPGNAQSPPTLQGISRRGPLPFSCSSLDSKEKKKKKKNERKIEEQKCLISRARHILGFGVIRDGWSSEFLHQENIFGTKYYGQLICVFSYNKSHQSKQRKESLETQL